MKLPNTLKFTGKDKSITGSKREELLRILQRRYNIKTKMNAIDKDIYGKVPSVFIGSYGYPDVRAGFLSTEEYSHHDEPKFWSSNEREYGIPELVKLRSDMTNSSSISNVKLASRNIGSKISDALKESSLTIKPVDAEIEIEKKPSFSLSLSPDRLPHGPSAKLRNMKITENPKIPGFVQKIESDTDLKAASSLELLDKKGFDEHYLTKIFSAGNLGIKEERKLVPTKWSITAVDDMLGKNISKTKIQDYKESDFKAYFGGYMGNYYFVLMLPGPWRYELFETYVGSGLSNPREYVSATDFEGSYGRKDYATNTVGGYYASRLAVLKHLDMKKENSSVLVLRFITDKYWVPLGVWVVREATRKALNQKSMDFSDIDLLIKYAKIFVMKKYNLDLDVLLKQSRLLREYKEQSSLSGFF